MKIFRVIKPNEQSELVKADDARAAVKGIGFNCVGIKEQCGSWFVYVETDGKLESCLVFAEADHEPTTGELSETEHLTQERDAALAKVAALEAERDTQYQSEANPERQR
jgi:hypothetical protein